MVSFVFPKIARSLMALGVEASARANSSDANILRPEDYTFRPGDNIRIGRKGIQWRVPAASRWQIISGVTQLLYDPKCRDNS